MSNTKSGTTPETAAEKSLSDFAMARFRDYKTRWAPLQARLASTIESMGKEGSPEREKLKASQAGDTTVAFDKAQQQLSAKETAGGINRASSASKLRREGMRLDRAASTGIGGAVADQMIDDAYVGGLQQLMAIGRGQEGAATKGIGQSAQLASEIARNDASLSASNRAANYEALGTGIGMAGGAVMQNYRAPSPEANQGGTNLFEEDAKRYRRGIGEPALTG